MIPAYIVEKYASPEVVARIQASPEMQGVVNNSMRFRFGKYKGRTLFEIFGEDPEYLQWLLAQEGIEARGAFYEEMKSYFN